MSRRRSPEKRDLAPDPRYGDVMVTKFINYCMSDGKRSVSESAFYRALETVKDKSGQEGIDVFRAMRWLISFARTRPEQTFADRLANELLMASKNEGPSIKKREDTHRMAEANRAFAHCRW
jgi:small subunit ribosomal protein S7